MELKTIGSIEEFLLSPWVLLQVPFRPAVQHQWTLALLAETLKFQMEISDLVVIQTPTTLHPALNILKNMSNAMYTCAQNFILVYLTWLGSKWRYPPDKTLISDLSKLLPTVKFVLSAECRLVIKALKHLAWSDQGIGECRSLLGWQEQIRPFDVMHIYSQDCWENENLSMFGYHRKVDGLSWQSIRNSANPSDGNIGALKILVEEKIIKAGRIGGVTRDTILGAVDVSRQMLLKVFASYNKYIGKYGFNLLLVK